MTLPNDQEARRTRDPQAKQMRILRAALQEFATHGLAGARVDRIAEQAGVNKQLIYHYFGSKDDLFTAVLAQFIERTANASTNLPVELGERLVRFFEQSNTDRDYTRLMAWEALAFEHDAVLREDERRAQFAALTAMFEADQLESRLPQGIQADQFLLTIVAVSAFARAFPQFARIITGLSPDDPAFVAARGEHLRQFGRILTSYAQAERSNRDEV